MTKVGTGYRVFVALLATAWLVSFGLSLDDVLSGTPYPPLLVTPAENPTDAPTVFVVQPGLGNDETDLRAGDRLVRVGGRDVAGIGIVEWDVLFAELRPAERVTIEYERSGVRMETSLRLGNFRPYVPRLFASAAFIACTMLLLVRVRSSPLQRAIVLMNLAVATLLVCFFTGSTLQSQLGFAAHLVSGSLVLPLSIRTYLLFPNKVPSGRALSRYGPWAFAILGPLDVSRFVGFPFSHATGSVGAAIVSGIFAVVVTTLLTRAYRRSNPAARRQFKWILLGLYLTAAPLAVASAIAAAVPGTGWLLAAAVSATGILPVCMLISVGRYNFLDVDGLLSGTAAATVVLGIGIGTAFIVLPPIVDLMTEELGIHRMAGQFLVVGLLLASTLPAQRMLRGAVTHVFFASQQELEAGIVRLNELLSECVTPQDLAKQASTQLASLFQVENCAIYIRSGDVFVPLDVLGKLDLPRFAKGSPLLTVLEDQPGPLARDVDAGGSRAQALGPFQQAVLDTLNVPLVLPIRRSHELVAFLCMDEKQSSDLYTPVDMSLLALVADKIASELRRFDQADIIEAEQAIQERLRRYIPGSVADQLRDGEELDSMEREVSILFVDIRGFSSYTEQLSPDEIFETVNGYTREVSTIIDEHGGTVVEFNGDGMMAVFGAPRSLELKERAAVRAGREIVERIPQLARKAGTLTVGVGVATGEAFVGSVQAVDRMIWTALGNTTNRASRLQALTRDYDAGMLIDQTTWQNAGREADHFWEIGELAIRGVEAKPVVYALPREVAA